MAEEKEEIKFEETASDDVASDENGDVIDEKRLLRKLDWHLIPGPALLLLLSFMDRGNGSTFRHLSHFAFHQFFFSWKCSHRGPRCRFTHEYAPPVPRLT